jgi:hypothetical protein
MKNAQAEPSLIMNMKTPFFGGCACGAIRYEYIAEPIEMFQCHCRDCQRASGGGCSCVVIVPAKSFKLTRGSLRYHFTLHTAGGQHKRGFCAECGSRITGGESAEGTSPIVGINAGSLDDPSWFRPRFDIFTADAQPWDYMDPALPKVQRVCAANRLAEEFCVSRLYCKHDIDRG